MDINFDHEFLFYNTAEVDSDSEECKANKCVIGEAPSNMRLIKWLNCDTCHMWFHGFCIKAKASDYRKKRWICEKCNNNPQN